MGLMPATAAIPALNTFTSLPDPPLPTITQTPDADASPTHATQGLASPSLQLPSQPVCPSTTSPSMPVGLLLGGATLLIPENIANKILKLDFVDTAELRPESWLFESETQEKPLSSLFKKRKQPVTDILIWTQCFASYTAVLAGKFQGCTPHLMAYMSTIIGCYRKFEGYGWVVYDTSYRRRAAIKKTLNWSEIDSSLFNTLFTGRAKTSIRCTECFGDDHESSQCPHTPSPLFQLSPGAAYSPLSGFSPQLLPTQRIQGPPVTPPRTCGLFNAHGGPQCTYGVNCKFIHACNLCFKNHPRSTCPWNRTTRGKRPPPTYSSAPKFPRLTQ